MNQGWECPKCQTIYAPHVARCNDCSGGSPFTLSSGPSKVMSTNQKICIDTYKCMNCEENEEKLKVLSEVIKEHIPLNIIQVKNGDKKPCVLCNPVFASFTTGICDACREER